MEIRFFLNNCRQVPHYDLEPRRKTKSLTKESVPVDAISRFGLE